MKKRIREGFIDNPFHNNSISVNADLHDLLGHDNDIDVPVLSRGTNNEDGPEVETEAWDTLWDEEPIKEGVLDGVLSGNSVNVNVGKLEEAEQFDDFDTQIQADELIPAGYEDDYDWNWEDFECEDPTDRNCPITEKCEKLKEGDAKNEISVCPDCGAIKYKGHPCQPKMKGVDIKEAAAKDEVSVCPTCGKIRYKKHKSCCESVDSKISEFVDSITEDAFDEIDKIVNKSKDLDLKEAKKADAEDDKLDELKVQVKDALDELIPEDDEEFDIHALIDAVLVYFDKDDCIEYIRSCICPEDEEEKFELPEDDEEVDEGLVPSPLQIAKNLLTEEEVAEDLSPEEQAEKAAIEGPAGIIHARDRERYRDLVELEKDTNRKPN